LCIAFLSFLSLQFDSIHPFSFACSQFQILIIDHQVAETSCSDLIFALSVPLRACIDIL